MKEIFQLIEAKHPSVAKLLRPATTDTILINKAKLLGLPKDYYDLYALLDGEENHSNGVFGLHKLLPLNVSINEKIVNKDELVDIPRKYQYDLFVPVFKTPGRQLIGYAKHENTWDFAEYDIWLGKLQYDSLKCFLYGFFEKLKNDGYIVEDGINGLIDKDEI